MCVCGASEASETTPICVSSERSEREPRITLDVSCVQQHVTGDSMRNWQDDAKRIKASLEADVCYEQHSRASTSHKWRAAKMLETPQNYHRDMNASGDISL